MKILKSVKEFLHENNSNEGILISEVYYNEEGKIIESIRNEDGIAEKNKYEYTKENLLKKETIYFEDEVTEIADYEYNTDNKLIKKTTKFADSSLSVETYNFNCSNNILEKKIINEDEELESLELITFDEKKRDTKQEFYDENNKLIKSIIKKYSENKTKENAEDIILEIEEKNFIEKTHLFTKFEYNEDNLLRQINIIDNKNNLIDKNIYTYNEDKKVIEILSSRGYKTIYEYQEDKTIESIYTGKDECIQKKISDKNDYIQEEQYIGFKKIYDYKFWD